MTPEEEKRLREVENACTNFRARWKEQGRINERCRDNHTAHYRHIKELTLNLGHALTEDDMTRMETKIEELRESLAQQKGAEKAWRTMGALLGAALVILQILAILR